MYQRLMTTIAVLVAVMLVSGCEGTFGSKAENSTSGTVDSSSSSTESSGSSGASTSGVGTGTTAVLHPLDDPASPLSNRTIYFDYDSSDVRPADRAAVEAHAQYLAEHTSAYITLEGHADERGSREYNLALGERRANEVRQIMTLLGASGAQIRVVSFGEERAAVDGHDESAWSLNRRAEIIYRTR